MINNAYVILRALPEYLKIRFKLNLDPQIISSINDLEDRFLGDFWPYIPPHHKKITFTTQQIQSKLEQAVEQSSLPTISLDDIYAPYADAIIQVTRASDENGSITGLRERAGHPALKQQIKALPIAEGSRVNLFDVATWSGFTVSGIAKLLKKLKGIEVDTIYVGVSHHSAREKLEKKYKYITFYEGELYDLLSIRDILSVDGYYLGTKDKMRHIYGFWHKIEEWFMVKPKDVPKVRSLCMQYHNELIDLLKVSGYKLKLKVH